MADLADMPFTPDRQQVETLTEEEIAALHRQIPEWEIVVREGIKRLERAFEFPDFRQALDFTVRVGEMAEAANHHPDLLTEWGRVTVTWWTHKVDGLHRNDMIAAARTDRLYEASA